MNEFIENFLQEIEKRSDKIFFIKDLSQKILFESKSFKDFYKFIETNNKINILSGDFKEVIVLFDEEVISSQKEISYPIDIKINSFYESLKIVKTPIVYNNKTEFLLCEIEFADLVAKPQIEKAELQFRIIADQFPLLIWTSRTDKLCDWFNSTWLQFTGRTMEQEIGNGWAEGVHPNDLEFCVHTYIKSFDNRKPFQMNYRLKNANGDYRIVRDYGSPRYNDKNEFIGYIGAVWDATEDILASQSLKESEERLRAFMSHSFNGIMIADKDGKIIEWNSALERMSGLIKEETLGKNIWDIELQILRKSNYEKFELSELKNKYIDFYSNNKTPWLELPFEYVLEHNKDSYRYVRIVKFKIKTSRGFILGVLINDITEQKYALDELFRLNKILEEANNIKSIIINNLGHELRTPLNGVLGFAQILKSELEDTEYSEAIDIIYQSGERLKNTLNSLLYLTELETNTIKLNTEIVDINEFIDYTVRNNKELFESHNLYIKYDLPEEIVFSIIDIYLLKQAIFNILDNSIKFTSEGGVTLKLDKVSLKEKIFARISIIDTGIGISQEKINKIFEPFRQVSEGIARSYEGIGLGLTVTQKMIAIMNGTINVKSEVNQGCEIELLFPIYEED